MSQITTVLGPSEIARLKDLIFEGINVKTEIQSLNEGLSDMVKSIGNELNIPTKLLKKTITVAFKQNFKDCEEELGDLDTLLAAVDKK
jgi:hypothetical protein